MNMFLLNAYDVENMISNLGCDASFLFPFISPLTILWNPFWRCILIFTYEFAFSRSLFIKPRQQKYIEISLIITFKRLNYLGNLKDQNFQGKVSIFKHITLYSENGLSNLQNRFKEMERDYKHRMFFTPTDIWRGPPKVPKLYRLSVLIVFKLLESGWIYKNLSDQSAECETFLIWSSIMKKCEKQSKQKENII